MLWYYSYVFGQYILIHGAGPVLHSYLLDNRSAKTVYFDIHGSGIKCYAIIEGQVLCQKGAYVKYSVLAH